MPFNFLQLTGVVAAALMGCDQSSGSPTRDTRDALNSDGAVCPDHPSDGCPCEPTLPFAKACCLGTGYGLVCDKVYPSSDKNEYRWAEFYDCGCIFGPPCERYEVYQHCSTMDPQ